MCQSLCTNSGQKNMKKKAQFQVKASYMLKVLLRSLLDSPANPALGTLRFIHTSMNRYK